VEIAFETRREAVDFYRQLPAAFRQETDVFLYNSRLAIITDEDTRFQELARIMTRYIVETYEKHWLLEIMEKYYFFTEPEEKLAILNIILAIFAGEKNDLPETETLPDRKTLIVRSLDGLLRPHGTFTFHSVLRFRLTAYRRVLRRFVEIAIDEYKLEQEYQVFIDKLRRIIRSYKPLCEKITVIDEQPFRLYDDRNRPIRSIQSVRSFYPLLKQWGIDAQPSIILTLIALAPKQVVVYTDRPGHSMMRTLHRVFEDRVCFLPGSIRPSGTDKKQLYDTNFSMYN
jgi:putative sporulation protein YtxC